MTRQLRKDPKNFGRWLKSQVAEGAVLCKCETDAGEKLVKLHKGGKGVQSSSFTAKTVEKLDPSRVEALDKDGNIVGVFDFPDPDGDREPAPGYLKEPGDTDEERLLKTFAHILADAHKESSRQLVSAVDIITRHHSEERKHMSGAVLSLERALGKLSRSRIRVAGASDLDDDEGEEEETGNEVPAWAQPLIQRMAAEYMGPKAHANGAASPEKE